MSRSTGVWGAFVLVHAVLGWICLGLPGTGIGEAAIGVPLYDVTVVYRGWMERALTGSGLVGVTEPWVYPVAAMLPMFAALLAGPELYGVTWLGLVTALNAVALAIVLGRRSSPRRIAAGAWWIAFTAALGPVALARIDAITVPLAVVAVLIVAKHPFVAGTLLAVATWIKVWPAALLLAMVIASRRRGRIIAAALTTSAAVAVIVVGMGGGAYLFGFIGEQTGRGLQVEAPAAGVFLWAAAAGFSHHAVVYSTEILTFQVAGPGVDSVATILTPLLALAVIATALFGISTVHRGAPIVSILPPVALALVVTLLLVNKVGSPQFVTWLVAPIILGIVWRGRGFRTPALVALAVAALTQSVYPYLYTRLLSGDAVLVALLTMRNIGYVILLGWALHAIVVAGRREKATRSAARPPGGVNMASGHPFS